MTRRTCDTVDLVAYLHHRLTPDETCAVKQHLETCSACRSQLADLQRVMSTMTDGLPHSEVPTDLKNKVLAAAYESRPPKLDSHKVDLDASGTGRHKEYLGSSAADVYGKDVLTEQRSIDRKRTRAAGLRGRTVLTRWLVAGIIVFAASTAVLTNQLIRMRQQLTEARQQLASSATTVTLQAMPSAKQAAGKAVFVQGKNQLRLILYAANLKPTKGTQVYHIWLWNHGQRSSAGVMTVGPKGIGEFESTLKDNHLDGIGITLEPNPSTSVPVGPKILGVKNIKIT